MKPPSPYLELKIDGHKVKLGDGATVKLYSDRHAATVVKLLPNQIHVQRDHAKRIDNRGMSDCQEYEYSPNPDGQIYVYKKTKKGWTCSGTTGLGLTYRNEYHDFSF